MNDNHIKISTDLVISNVAKAQGHLMNIIQSPNTVDYSKDQAQDAINYLNELMTETMRLHS